MQQLATSKTTFYRRRSPVFPAAQFRIKLSLYLAHNNDIPQSSKALASTDAGQTEARQIDAGKVENAIYVFDFDGTITTKDTFALFLRYYAGLPRWTLNVTALLPTFIAYKLGLIDRHAVKKAVVKRFFTGADAQALDARAAQFAKDVIPGLIRPAAQSRLNALLSAPDSQRESLYICSASIGPYLRHWAKTQNIAENHVLATELESINGAHTGALEGYNVWGPNKVRRIHDTFLPQSVKILEAYGDTRGDKEMLHAADVSFFKPFRF